MLKKLYLIGIGPGDPKYLTLEAKSLIEKLNLFLIPEKKGKKEELTKKRIEILEVVKGGKTYQCIYLPFPERKRGINYREKVKEWRKEKAEILREALLHIQEEEVGFLIWGDPTLYDGHLDILHEIAEEMKLSFEVIPGLSSFQVLGAKMKVSLTDLATPLTLHTPRSLRNAKEIKHPVVVFLDNYETFSLFKDQPLKIYWGAYVGGKEEIFKSGTLKDISEEIKNLRKELKKNKGYLMEIYLLKPER
ncbi:precorrin 6A synthase [Caldimicrobium thiodismutans]|jgi:precorrin-6A synthase|uniref:Precorrin 6A synthase n=1 Tax=Caldimicrobium thiodismutans TaxID=1653476 RepID=A0A0U5AK61_9BACT|nr:precorrin-6A synthase (deacetylating) [Caldimicrobium thiodismutans]BAU22484.1 precorrin 6A synthase [Caldimicrobium thiodismutans]